MAFFLLPFLIKGAAAAVGIYGASSAVKGASKMKNANDTIKAAKSCHDKNMARFESENKIACQDMDKLGTLELDILRSFSTFSDVFERIHNRPEFDKYTKNGIELPKYDGEKIREVSVGAGVLLGGIGGAGLGAAGGFAAAGATSAAVAVLGTASTGTAIGSLSGVAATNATLAWLGGGTIAAGGGGIAAGAAALGAATLGVGLLVGGVAFNLVGEKISDQANDAWNQMKRAENKINDICSYLSDLRNISNEYYMTLSSVNMIYRNHLKRLEHAVNTLGHDDWNNFSDEEKKLTQNTSLLVGLLYNMCKVELVLKAKSEDEPNKINSLEIKDSIYKANMVMTDNDFGIA